MKDLIKMTIKEREFYLDNFDVDKELKKAKDFLLESNVYFNHPSSQIVRQSHKLLFGHIRQPKTDNEKFNWLMIYLTLFLINDIYDEFIKYSETL